MISAVAFKKLSTLVDKHTGIHLSESKKQLVYSRLAKRLRLLNIDDYALYHDVCLEDEKELQVMINAITTNDIQKTRQ